jgi:hypothetical protein
MFKSRNQNLIILILAGIVLTELAILLWLRPQTHNALAQGGDNSHKVGNYEQWKNQAPGDYVAISPADKIDSQSDGSGIEVISNGAFRNDGDSVDGWYNLFSEGFIRNNGPIGACFMAPTYPPNGATLTQFSSSILDQSVDDMFVELKRVRLTTGAVELIAGGNISRNDPAPVELFTSIAPGTALVSNTYAYYVDLCFPANSDVNILFYGARLFYTP